MGGIVGEFLVLERNMKISLPHEGIESIPTY